MAGCKSPTKSVIFINKSAEHFVADVFKQLHNKSLANYISVEKSREKFFVTAMMPITGKSITYYVIKIITQYNITFNLGVLNVCFTNCLSSPACF